MDRWNIISGKTLCLPEQFILVLKKALKMGTRDASPWDRILIEARWSSFFSFFSNDSGAHVMVGPRVVSEMRGPQWVRGQGLEWNAGSAQ